MFSNLASQFHNQILKKHFYLLDLRKKGKSGDDRSVLAAIECASALFHFREHMPKSIKKSRAKISKECPEYRLIADVTNAVKHGHLTKPTPDGAPLVSSASDISELLISTKFEDDEGEYTNCESVVLVECTDGKNRCLDDGLVAVINYWGNALSNLNIKSFKPVKAMPYPGSIFVPRAEAKSFSLTVTQGLSFNSRWQFLRYDNKLGRAMPVDLTEADVRLRMYRPKHNVDLVIDVPNLDEKIKLSFELTDEESQEYIMLKTKLEKEVYEKKWTQDHAEEIEKRISEAVAEKY